MSKKSEHDLLSEILSELKLISDQQKTLMRILVRDKIEANLSSPKKRAVYELTDGKRSARDIASLLDKAGTKVTHTTVENYWKKWTEVGLVQTSSTFKGRCQRNF